MAAQDRDLRCARDIPDAGGLVRRRRDDACSVGAEGRGHHRAIMAAQDRNLRCARGVPDVRGPIAYPSGLKTAEWMSLTWPRRTAISFAVAASQMRAVLSSDARGCRFAGGLAS